mgnify:CR=1 FL=1
MVLPTLTLHIFIWMLVIFIKWGSDRKWAERVVTGRVNINTESE